MSVSAPTAANGSHPSRGQELDGPGSQPGPPAEWPPESIRVGVDVVPVFQVAESVTRFGDRYVHRIFTEHEVGCCRTELGPANPRHGYSAQSLASRFAAKEAVVKVLRPRGSRPEWRSIEVHRNDGGWCEIRLSGRAATLAEEAGIYELAVSLTHEEAMAAAVVIGRCRVAGGEQE